MILCAIVYFVWALCRLCLETMEIVTSLCSCRFYVGIHRSDIGFNDLASQSRGADLTGRAVAGCAVALAVPSAAVSAVRLPCWSGHVLPKYQALSGEIE